MKQTRGDAIMEIRAAGCPFEVTPKNGYRVGGRRVWREGSFWYVTGWRERGNEAKALGIALYFWQHRSTAR